MECSSWIWWSCYLSCGKWGGSDRVWSWWWTIRYRWRWWSWSGRMTSGNTRPRCIAGRSYRLGTLNCRIGSSILRQCQRSSWGATSLKRWKAVSLSMEAKLLKLCKCGSRSIEAKLKIIRIRPQLPTWRILSWRWGKTKWRSGRSWTAERSISEYPTMHCHISTLGWSAGMRWVA